MRLRPMLIAATGFALVVLIPAVGATQATGNVQTARLVLADVKGVCTPDKPDVTISKRLHSSGLQWEVQNDCSLDVDVDVFGFAPIQTGPCRAASGSRPFKETSLAEPGIKKKSKKPFAKTFTLTGDEGCWSYKVKVDGRVFDPQIKVER